MYFPTFKREKELFSMEQKAKTYKCASFRYVDLYTLLELKWPEILNVLSSLGNIWVRF